ncbi:MAG: SCO family protein [Caldilineaceae bacterium]|nr:SCO family protein [Caldilineaceae bacterium]
MATVHAHPIERSSVFFQKSKLLYVLLALPLVAILLFVTMRPVLVLPRIRLAPGYLLINQNGDRVSHENLRGHIVIYNMAFTHCGEECADSWALMAGIQEQLSRIPTEIPIDLVTISVDPERDTPEALRDFARAQGIDTTRWHLLTGDADHVKMVVGAGMDTYYAADASRTLKVEPSILIVDGVGILRRHYRLTLPTQAEVLRDLDLLLTEAINSTGITRYAYEAAHLFVCYP